MSKFLKFILIFFFLSFFGGNQIFAQCTDPVSPTDGATGVPFPVSLDWCNVSGAQSYYVQLYKGGNPICTTGSLESNVTIPSWLCIFNPNTNYQWQFAACSNDDGTKCGESCADDEAAADCASSSDKWGFTTGQVTLNPPQLISPLYDPANPGQIPSVNIYDSLQWVQNVPYSVYEIKSGAATVVVPTVSSPTGIELGTIWSSFQLNTIYNWHVKSCNDEAATDCSSFGETWYFKTTGSAPISLSIDNDIIPVKLDWEDVDGAASYIYEVSSGNSFAVGEIVDSDNVENSEVPVDYPALVQDTLYYWRVKTCADRESAICGSWSAVQSFRTFRLSTPTNPFPENNGTLLTSEKTIAWQEIEGAKAYQYTIDYISAVGETNEDCVGLPPIKIIPTDPPAITSFSRVRINLGCLGTYQWSVRACLDTDCFEAGDWATPPWQFTLIQPEPPAQFGILPCNRVSDNPKTPWNERDSCELKHIILVVKGIIDFVLWRAGLIALGLLVVATAVIYFFSLGGSSAMADVKSLWKRAGQGYAIMLFSWIIINLIVRLIGFTDQWWVLPF